MKKLPSIGVAVFGTLIGALAVVGLMGPVQAYPETSIDVKVSSQTVYSGASFTATGESQGTVCHWTLEWDRTVRTGTSSDGHPFTTGFTAPQVKKEKKIPLHAACEYDGADTGASGTQTWRRTIVITVLAPTTSVEAPKTKSGVTVAGPGGGSDLPNTGGPNVLFLLGGLVLLLSGTTAVTVARRRATEAEIHAFRA
jgi:LPXTG-motif cell wall-anchored protein